MSAFATRQPSRADPPPPLPPRAPAPPPGRVQPPRRSATHGSVSIGILALVTALVLFVGMASVTWYRVAHTLETAKPVKVPTIHPISGIIWAGRVFNTRAAMAAWLHSRGASYARWERRNPELARVLATR